jgi:cytochrome c
MRALVVSLVLATGAAGCGQSSPADGPSAAGAGQPASAAAPEPTAAEKQAILASLPAPYNSADLANGRAKFALCRSCHTITPGGANMTGPNLHGVFGRPAGGSPDFKSSEALQKAGFVWDAQHMDPWLAQPRTYIPGTKMTFVGMKNAKDRTDLIAYMMVESGYKPQ